MLLGILPLKVLKLFTLKNNKKMAQTNITIEVPLAGGTVSLDPNNLPDIVYLIPETSGVITGTFTLNGGSPIVGTKVSVLTNLNGIVLGGGYEVSIFGVSYTQKMLDVVGRVDAEYYLTSFPYGYPFYRASYAENSVFDGRSLVDRTVTLAKLEALTSAQIIVGNASNEPTATAVTGDVTISNAGVTAIGSGVIVNADINASAAIARTKLASGAAAHVVINDGTGAFSSEAQLSPVRGGTGVDASAATGFLRFAAGTGSVAAIADSRDIAVSFEAGELGDYKIKIPYACTLTEIYGYATKVIAGTDAGTIVAKNNSGTTMTNGTMTFASGDARGSAYTINPSANNTFVAGDILTLTTAKTTAGGKVQLSLTFTRTT